MADVPRPTSGDLADRLRRWIVVAGYILGGWAILQAALIVIAWGLPFNLHLRVEWMTRIHRVGIALYLVSPLVLVSGCWGFQHHRRWARPVLLTYAGMWIAALLGMQGMYFLERFMYPYPDSNFLQRVSAASNGLDLLVYSSVYPIALVLCLTWPEVRDQFAEFRTGFAPILDAHKS